MTWDAEKKVESEVKEPEVKPEDKPSEKEVPVGDKEEKPVEKEAESGEKMVPQKLIGQVAKKIREKGRGEMAEAQNRIKQLEEENRQLKTGETPNSEEDEEGLRISQKVREEFLRRQDAYGKKKYGEDSYADAILLVSQQQDPLLIAKIQGAASPADTLMEEAMRIAEDMELGSSPDKRKEALKAQIRKEVEAEMAEKLKARGNQPTDVKSVRTAGGNEKSKVLDNWGTALRRSP